MRALLLVLAVALCGAEATARDLSPRAASPDARCAAAAEAAGATAGIPKGLMLRLALVESGRPLPDEHGKTMWQPWPWTIDADGVDHVFATQSEAVAWAAAASNVRFLDAGCLQVNLQYHPHAFANLIEAFDPWDNALYAARYLRSLYESGGHDWALAVGWYHSQTPDLAEEYRARVASLGAGIIAGLPRPTLAARLRLVGLMRVPLAGGGTLRLQLNRQPSLRAPPHRSPCEVAAALAPLMASPPKLTGCAHHAAN